MRTKAKAESAALHAGLRKEQMKVESLERTLQQKVTTCPSLSAALPAVPVAALSILLMLEVSSRFLVQKVFCGFGFWGVFLICLGFFFFCVLWGWLGFFGQNGHCWLTCACLQSCGLGLACCRYLQH